MRWLADFVELPTADPAEIAGALESMGHEVEAYQQLTADFERVVIGRVTGIAAHPDADKIRVCTVDVGDPAGDSEIVCGAWNFEVGAVVPVALPGARLGEATIERRSIRSVVSNGMICSERELGLGDEHAGIMVLDAEFPEAAATLGSDFAALLDLPDTLFDVDITPNRPDCMSVLGLAESSPRTTGSGSRSRRSTSTSCLRRRPSPSRSTTRSVAPASSGVSCGMSPSAPHRCGCVSACATPASVPSTTW